MHLKTVLNRVFPLKGSVYESSKFDEATRQMIVDVRPRASSDAEMREVHVCLVEHDNFSIFKMSADFPMSTAA
jgi:hypothetical protein